MKFEAFWQRLCEKNPELRDETGTMKINVASFKRSMRQAHDMGVREQAPPGRPSPFADIFSDFKL